VGRPVRSSGATDVPAVAHGVAVLAAEGFPVPTVVEVVGCRVMVVRLAVASPAAKPIPGVQVIGTSAAHRRQAMYWFHAACACRLAPLYAHLFLMADGRVFFDGGGWMTPGRRDRSPST
jgi:hypothetical protein